MLAKIRDGFFRHVLIDALIGWITPQLSTSNHILIVSVRFIRVYQRMKLLINLKSSKNNEFFTIPTHG